MDCLQEPVSRPQGQALGPGTFRDEPRWWGVPGERAPLLAAMEPSGAPGQSFQTRLPMILFRNRTQKVCL